VTYTASESQLRNAGGANGIPVTDRQEMDRRYAECRSPKEGELRGGHSSRLRPSHWKGRSSVASATRALSVIGKAGASPIGARALLLAKGRSRRAFSRRAVTGGVAALVAAPDDLRERTRSPDETPAFAGNPTVRLPDVAGDVEYRFRLNGGASPIGRETHARDDSRKC
jgi:hypothetical protein